MHRSFFLVAFTLPLGIALPLPATDPGPKTEDLLLIQKGTLPIIVSAPHGGRKKIPEVSERLGKGLTNFQTVLDTNTAELTEIFAAELQRLLDGKPWMVVARFERKYVDANRSAEHGYESDKAKPYYDAYHGALETACKAVKAKFGRGLLLDIHGQGEFVNAICRGTKNGKTVSLMKERYGWQALTGKHSVLGQLERDGYTVMPRCNADEKSKEEPQFNGGYIVTTYGSHTGHAIDAIQLEFGSILRKKEKDRHAKTAKDLAAAVARFHDEYLIEKK